MAEMLTLEAFEEASLKVKEVTQETKLIESPYLSAQTGNRMWLKPENMQRTGAYKLRGAYYKISKLSQEELDRGVITASAGNHAQGVAYAASHAGARSVVVMPTTTPLIKVERTKGYGAEVILHGDVFDDAKNRAVELAEQEGLTYIPPFNDLTVATGQGTIAMEIVQELPLVDTILVPVGGGLACSVSTFAKLHNPKITFVIPAWSPPARPACAPRWTPATWSSSPAPTPSRTAPRSWSQRQRSSPTCSRTSTTSSLWTMTRLVACFLDMVENHKMVVENSGLLTVAAAKHLPAEGKRVVSILSGGNMDVITMSSVVQNGLIQRGRIFTVSVLLPDRPGMLVRVANVIAEQNGNVIKLEHNQFVSTNRQAAVELRVTIEAYGESHKAQIVGALDAAGFKPETVQTSL